MAARGVTVADLDRFRVALEAAVARSTLRSVARKVGMSPTGLAKFLDGTTPYGPTVERVRDWYYSEAGVHQFPPSEIAALLRRVVATLPEPDRGVGHLLDAVERAYQEGGMFAPGWVRSVREHLSERMTGFGLGSGGKDDPCASGPTS